jgi:hypothetical protein
MGILDDAAKQDSTQPQVSPATPTAQPQGGSILEQAAEQQKTAASTSTVPPVESESMSDRWAREAYETVGQAVPQWAATGMRGLQTGLLDKFHQSSRELGNIAEHKINTFLSYADQATGDLEGDLGGTQKPHEAIPAYAKGLEGSYMENKFETGSPITAGVTGGLANLGGQILGDPTNWPFLAKGLLTKVGAVGEAAFKPWAEKLMSKGFGIQMTKGVYDQLDALSEQWSKMGAYERSKAITQVIAGTYMAQDALRAGFKGTPVEKSATVSPEQGGEGPLPSTKTGTVTGESEGPLSAVKTRTTAGVTAPVSAKAAATLDGQQPSILTRAAEGLTSPIAERDFGKEQVAPAATRQAQSTLGQVAEDNIAAHQAVVNGEVAPEQIAGTQKVSRFVEPDDAWREMQKVAKETTLATADTISKREQASWESKRDESIQEYKELVDRHNKNIDDYNAQVKPEDRMPHAVFDPSEVNVAERPMSYNELRADVQTQEANAKSSDAAVREEAINKGVPKAQKALDNWFKQHADEITPSEYESFKKLWANSERFKEIANGLRAPLLKGTLTGNTMRQVEASMNTRQIRRGQAPDAFQRLLGPDGYNNWHNVAKLFDTVKDPSLPEMFKSWGAYAGEYLVSALLPHLGLGPAIKWTTEKLLNHVMFDPEFGSAFSDTVDWLKSRGSFAVQSIKELPEGLRNKFVSIIKSYQDSKASSERGAAGAGVKQGNAPEPNKFGRTGVGGTPTFADVQAASNPQRDTDLLAQVRAEMPTASLSEQLMEAARRANPTSQPQHPSVSADAYNEKTGRLPLNQEKVDVDSRKAVIADAYEAMKHDPNDPKVKESYQALIDESKAQMKHLENQGYTFSRSATDPYHSFEEMRDDVRKNKHLGVWTGGNPLPEGHPLAAVDPETGWRHNDTMRVVHDFMGHAAGDNDFSEKGEENAYNLHKQSFSEKAIPALTTETKGQTSWFFNNKDVRNGSEVGRYAEQKAGVLPESSYQTDRAQHISDLTNANGGATYNPIRGNMIGQDAYAVPMFPDLSRTVNSSKVTPAQIKGYLQIPEVQARLKANPKLNVGTWVNDGKVYLDLSLAVPDRAEAVRVGQANGQKAITYLKDMSEISLGGRGTGTPLDATLEAHHWSSVPNLTETNPDKMGTGVRGAERQRMNEQGFVKRTNFGLKGYKEPAVQSKPYHYVSNLDASKYYDAQNDPSGIWQKGFQDGGATGAEKAVRDAGYHGYRVGNELASFEPVRVRPAQENQPVEPPQPVYIDRKNGFHEVVTGPSGHLLAHDVEPEGEGTKQQEAGEVQISTHWVAPEMRGKGVGTAQIEALAKSLPTSKTAVLSDSSMTDSAIGSWKRLQSLYPTAVSEQPNGQWKFDLEKMRTPAIARTTAAPKGSSVELMSNPLPVKASGENGVNTIDVAKALNRYTKRNLGALKPGSEPEEMVARATELAENEAQYQLAQNNSGTTWYTEQMDEHDKIAKEMRPALENDTKLSLFKMAEAILSSGQKPYRNFTSTMEAWDQYEKHGAFPSTNPETGKSWGPRGIKAYANAFESINRLVEEKGEKGAVDWLMGEHPVSELREYNKDVAGKKADLRHGVIILGEKRGPFAQNLHGLETAFTADMWVSRTWNRWMGTIEVEPETGEITSDSPRNQQERSLMKQSFSEVASKMGMTTSSLQAVLWYYEQALYSAHGTPKESWSFSDAARRAQAEEKARMPDAKPPQEPVSFGPRPADLARRAREESFNPEEFASDERSEYTQGVTRNPKPPTWIPPANLKEGIPHSEPVQVEIPLSELSVSRQAFDRASTDNLRGRGSRTKGPIEVFYDTHKGQYLVEDGMHRLVQAHAAGQKVMPAKLWSGYSDVIANVSPEDRMDLTKK